MKLKIIYCIVLMAAAMTSCTPDPIDLEVDSAPSKLVVFSHVVPDNIMILGLTKSFSLLDGVSEENYSDLLVSGATVTVESNGQIYDFYELTTGFYASFNPLQQTGDVLNLTAIKGADTVKSSTTVLSQVNFTNVLPIIDKLPTDTTVHIQMDFMDEVTTDNWYMINVYKKNDSNNSQLDGVNFFENGSNLLEKTILFTDDEFDVNYSEKHKFDGIYHEDSVVVTLSNISEDYYNYLVLRTQAGSIFNQVNLEPLTYPSNVENGYGFFNAHFPDLKYFDLDEF
ncbi:MAG: DUF4249 domain-containing protein [Crocinitomicaceae bacterium]|nr:DUF4249 domain-containing protein [Crocinitomicaceae bacterium]